jgi:hypothetical protein
MSDDGLFKPKYVVYFTLYCEMCVATWKKEQLYLPTVWLTSKLIMKKPTLTHNIMLSPSTN